MKISGVYKITNTITGDFYIGSSNNVKQRWAAHKWQSTWENNPNNPMYLDMQKYGVENFEFQIIAEAEVDHLKELEQQFIEELKPTYNSNNANGLDIERYKEYQKQYQKEYYESNKQQKKQYRESHKQQVKQYQNQLCSFNGEVLTLHALSMRFSRAGVEHPVLEAKKYLLH